MNIEQEITELKGRISALEFENKGLREYIESNGQTVLDAIKSTTEGITANGLEVEQRIRDLSDFLRRQNDERYG